jgi:hypothetical protein
VLTCFMTLAIVICRGVPVWEYSKEKTALVYWGFGTYWGNARANNKKGHLIGHIKDIGHDPTKPETRLYATREAQPWHNDAADLVSKHPTVVYPPLYSQIGSVVENHGMLWPRDSTGA